MADGLVAPGDDRNPHRAVELRHVEGDRRLAVVADFHRALEECDQFFLGWAALGAHERAVTAGADAADNAGRAVDQPAIDVADFEAQRPLPKIPGFRIGALVVGQVEDADIDGGDRDIGLAARREAGKRYRYGQRRARFALLRQVDRHVELAVAGGDGQPFDADGAHRHAVFRCVGRTIERRGDIGTRPPCLGDRQVDRRPFGAHRRGGDMDDAVRTDRHQHFAGEARRNPELRGVADSVVFLVEGDFETVRHFRRGGLDIPAGVEDDRAFRIDAPLDIEAIAAPADRHLDARGITGGQVQRAVGDLVGIVDDFIVPGIAVTVPLVVPLDLDE